MADVAAVCAARGAQATVARTDRQLALARSVARRGRDGPSATTDLSARAAAPHACAVVVVLPLRLASVRSPRARRRTGAAQLVGLHRGRAAAATRRCAA